MNKLTITGNLGNQAELRTLDSGSQAISFSVAVSEKYTNRAGETVQETIWVNCTKWVQPGKPTNILPFLKKGTRVLIIGKASVRAYQNNAGVPMASLELRVDDLELLGQPADPQNPTSQPAAHQTATPPPAATASQNTRPEPKEEPIDDLPF